jgi:anion-transporting  ArsA/GET3 family ATPase
LTPTTLFSQARVLIVTGKGGTGKTTVSGVMANLAADGGLRAMVFQIGAPGARYEPGTAQLARLFGSDEVLGYEASVLKSNPNGGSVNARAVTPDTALVEYLHLHGMRRLSRRLVSSGALDVVATAVPGMPDMLVLGKLKQMERAAAAGQPNAPDVVVLDAPATGHAVRFLQSPRGLLDATAGGPVRAQAEEVVEMLSDPQRCQVVLVTTPEETPVSETVETAHLLEERVGVRLLAVVVNGRLPVLALPPEPDAGQLGSMARELGVDLTPVELEAMAAAARLRLERQEVQAVQVARLGRELALPQLELPFCFNADLRPPQLATLTDAMSAAAARLAPAGAP